jgi:hypothetical protein
MSSLIIIEIIFLAAIKRQETKINHLLKLEDHIYQFKFYKDPKEDPTGASHWVILIIK